jgi:cytochrome c peroxidase
MSMQRRRTSVRRTTLHALALWAAGLVGLAGCKADPCDGLDAAQCEQVRALAMPASLPPARGNTHGDDLGAAELGFRIFFDSRFSSNQEVRCATCHAPENGFADGKVTSTGLGPVGRNSPTAFNAAADPWMMWDGRADSVWSQALLPLESPVEMGFTRLDLAHRIDTSYRALYVAAFGPLPGALGDTQRFPLSGKPGDPAFDGMSPEDRDAVNRVAANVGKAIEAYQRKLFAGASPLDEFLGGKSDAMSGGARQGLAVFAKSGCLACHGGPYLSDGGFHRLGVPDGAAGPDRGRAAGLEALARSEFTLAGPYSDDPSAFQPPPAPTAADEGAFKTPSLRNLARTAPYGHNGSFATLEEVVDFHLQGGGSGADPLLQPRALSSWDRDALVEFLRSLQGADPGRPWDYWPEG